NSAGAMVARRVGSIRCGPAAPCLVPCNRAGSVRMAAQGEDKLPEKKVIAVKDWTCAMSDELGRVALTVNPTDGEPILVLLTIFQAAKMGRELQSPKRVQFSI
ncbi:hypothetical protein, partial [Mesorhizobium sp. M1A.F.Ca.IN.022.02.1.1]|uniref:hypothetical protein n=1 Tax=Mesorhizobium sp. M1A.F.Ca.IN.022.02.1.1 TaxID=2496766 RepID=UPI0019D115E9